MEINQIIKYSKFFLKKSGYAGFHMSSTITWVKLTNIMERTSLRFICYGFKYYDFIFIINSLDSNWIS